MVGGLEIDHYQATVLDLEEESYQVVGVVLEDRRIPQRERERAAI